MSFTGVRPHINGHLFNALLKPISLTAVELAGGGVKFFMTVSIAEIAFV